jgi:selenocysteine lyase/cysteine desulfurase
MQPYGMHTPSRLGGEEMDEARRRVAGLLGVTAEELSFGPSTTQNTYVLAQAFREMLSPGDAIIVTNQDHEANTGPWRRLAEHGIAVREWRVDRESGHLDPAALAELLDEDVKLVCFPQCSNVVGEVNDVAAICEMVHAAGALACVDGVSYAPHGFCNVAELGADIYLFSAYKTFGPHQGVMVLRGDLAQRLPNQAHFFNGDVGYKRLTPAGPDHAQIAASAGMADYIEALAAHHGLADGTAPGEAGLAARSAAVHELMRAREVELLQPLLDYARGRNGWRLLGPAHAEKRAPTVAIDLGYGAGEAAARLAAAGIGCGAGSFYSVRALEGMGVDPEQGVLRVSFVHYTADAELDRLLEALDQLE